MLKLNKKLLESNKHAEICSVYVAPDEIEKTLARNAATIRDVAEKMRAYRPEQMILVGSGASYCTLYTGHYFLRTCSAFPASLWRGPELTGDDPMCLKGRRTIAILASYSGKTADTVNAAKYLKKMGVPRIAICRDDANPLAALCDQTLPYFSKCLYTSAMTNLLMFLAEFIGVQGEKKAARKLTQALQAIPSPMRAVLDKSDTFGRGAVEKVKNEELFYCLGDGALWGLAYQYGYTHIMEYTKAHAACLRSSEWRHGPLEILHRQPTILMFIGNDATRDYARETGKYCERHGGRVVAFDVKNYFDTHPVLAPFVLHAVGQLFLLYLTTAKGIDFTAYRQMHVHPYLPGETYF